MTVRDELDMLRLRQARRRERPYTIAKVWFVFCFVIVGLAFAQGCCSGTVERQTTEQKKHVTDSIWDGDANAHKRRTN